MLITSVIGVQMWVAEPSRREDLCTLVLAYLQGTVPHPPVDNAVNFYQAAKTAAVSILLAPDIAFTVASGLETAVIIFQAVKAAAATKRKSFCAAHTACILAPDLVRQFTCSVVLLVRCA